MDKESYIVPPEVFETYGQDQKLNTMFHYIRAMHTNIEVQNGEIVKLKRRKLIDKGVAVGSGTAGGAAAMVIKWFATKLFS